MKLRELIKVMLFMLCLPNVSKFYYCMKFKNLIEVMREHVFQSLLCLNKNKF